MTDLGVQRIFGDDDAGALDPVMDETRPVHPRAVVDVLQPVSHVRRDLHSRGPACDRRVVRVDPVPEAVAEVRALHELVDQVDVALREGRAEQLRDAAVVAPADRGEELAEAGEPGGAAEPAAEDGDVAAAE